MSEKYNSKIIEKKWQRYWSDNKLFESKVIEGKKIVVDTANGMGGLIVPSVFK